MDEHGKNNRKLKRYPPFLKNGSSGKPSSFPFVSRTFVPSVFTVMNMLCGYIAIVMAGQSNFATACWFIILAAFFDTVDGFIARITNGTSDFGFELDSLSDLVSFGAAPAYLAYKFGLEQLPAFSGIVVSSMVVIGSGLRLARFNISVIDYRKESFSGLPTPAQALTIAGFVLWMKADAFLPEKTMHIALGWLSTFLALLMVSKVNYDALPKPTVEAFRRNPFQMAFYVGAVFCVLLFQSKAFFLAMLLYILLGIVRSATLAYRQWQT
ncbi:MAG: CDP-diacylglycerol--serine O-phosphatidyltransferase [Chlorobiaceae bacterium]|nr:CDP-diacylglycerol--serine O-phosphatidyltransferase [Chlorobiaceae bacterium]